MRTHWSCTLCCGETCGRSSSGPWDPLYHRGVMQPLLCFGTHGKASTHRHTARQATSITCARCVVLRTKMSLLAMGVPQGCVTGRIPSPFLGCTYFCAPGSWISSHIPHPTSPPLKVTLEVKSEAQLHTLSSKLTDVGIAHKLWVEQPENYATCIATAPAPRSHLQPLMKKLQLCRGWPYPVAAP